MIDVHFDEESEYNQNSFLSRNTEPKGLIKWVIKLGLAPDEKQANYFLIGFILVCVLVSIFLLIRIGSPSPVENEEIILIAGPGAKP
jgi:hypothetical protein